MLVLRVFRILFLILNSLKAFRKPKCLIQRQATTLVAVLMLVLLHLNKVDIRTGDYLFFCIFVVLLHFLTNEPKLSILTAYRSRSGSVASRKSSRKSSRSRSGSGSESDNARRKNKKHKKKKRKRNTMEDDEEEEVEDEQEPEGEGLDSEVISKMSHYC